MQQAKYKVGDEVTVPGCGPRKIVSVEACYRFAQHGALWREDELQPYVRPLQVGDRAKWCHDHLNDPQLRILAIDGNTAWCKRIGLIDGYVSLALSSVERIPEGSDA